MIQIDQSEFFMALDSNDMDPYLDMKTGKIIFCAIDCEEEKIDVSYVQNHPDEYHKIEPIDFYYKLDRAREFIADEVKEPGVQGTLSKAFNQRKGFREFKNALCDFPNVRERWFDYENLKLFEYARQYLEENDIKGMLF